MTYQTIRINSAPATEGRPSVLVIYTGGTFGMIYDRKADQLIPFDFERALDYLPELHRFTFGISLIALPNIIDSSNMTPGVWVELAELIRENYAAYDSFVILHGTDTMSYTASALSFMLDGLSKPVILTGAQLPIGVARTDARENFMTALEIATAAEEGQPLVPEVCVYFNGLLLRGNRSTKHESVQFNAFTSENYPALATAGVSIDYNRPFIRARQPNASLLLRTQLDPNVVILKLFPGITEAVVTSIISIPGLRGVVLETFGAGNAPTAPWFLTALKAAIDRGVVVFNVSQCEGGRVTQGRYQTGKQLQEIGVVSGADITTEAAITKLMVLLGADTDSRRVAHRLGQPLCGEMSE